MEEYKYIFQMFQRSRKISLLQTSNNNNNSNRNNYFENNIFSSYKLKKNFCNLFQIL